MKHASKDLRCEACRAALPIELISSWEVVRAPESKSSKRRTAAGKQATKRGHQSRKGGVIVRR